MRLILVEDGMRLQQRENNVLYSSVGAGSHTPRVSSASRCGSRESALILKAGLSSTQPAFYSVLQSRTALDLGLRR